MCVNAGLNHSREMLVIEIISRAAEKLVRDGLLFLSEDEAEQFNLQNIKKCLKHYINEIFSDASSDSPGEQVIWDFISDHVWQKYGISLKKDILSKVHLNPIFKNLVQNLNIELNKDFSSFNFKKSEEQQSLIELDDIKSIRPTVKDYRYFNVESDQLAGPFPLSLSLVLKLARQIDQKGKKSQWFMLQGPEREQASKIFRMGARIARNIFGPKSVHYADVLLEFGQHLIEVHQQNGRPENSRWNHCASVNEDPSSIEARTLLEEALEIYEESKFKYSPKTAEILMDLARLCKFRSDLADEKLAFDCDSDAEVRDK